MSKIDVAWEKIKLELMDNNYDNFFDTFKTLLDNT